MYLQFAWRYFRAKKSANAINIIAWVTTSVIAFATCCQVLVLSVFNGFEELVRSLYSTFYADLKVSPHAGKTIFLTPQQISEVRKQPYVAAASLVVEEKALLQNGEAQTVVYLKGVDENYTRVSGIDDKIVRGEFAIGSVDEPGMIMGSGIQSATGISTNPAFNTDPTTIILPKKTLSKDPLESLSEGNVTATGVFAIQQEFDNQFALTNINFVRQQMALEPDEYSAIEIRLNEKENIEDRKADLIKLLGTNYKVQTKYEQNTNLYNTMRTEKWAIFAVLTLILIIAAFNMISALTMLVLEKKRDIAILQSMGSRRSQLRKIFLSEGLLLGVLGAATGILLAVVISLLQLKYEFIPLQGGSFLIDHFPVKLIWTDFLLVSGAALLIAFIASWFPAYKASRQPLNLR
ncbi:MAG: ABC transporter permease [Chitinophagaceae bacterium]|nr:MAG: ABC transporter permease [Chitinophagaceae bacterium]